MRRFFGMLGLAGALAGGMFAPALALDATGACHHAADLATDFAPTLQLGGQLRPLIVGADAIAFTKAFNDVTAGDDIEPATVAAVALITNFRAPDVMRVFLYDASDCFVGGAAVSAPTYTKLVAELKAAGPVPASLPAIELPLNSI